MSTQSPAPRTGADPAPATAPAHGVTRAPAGALEPGTRYAGSISLAAALAGILLGASSPGPRTTSRPAVRQTGAHVAGIHR